MTFDIYMDGKKTFEKCNFFELDHDKLFVYGDGEDYEYNLKDIQQITLKRFE